MNEPKVYVVTCESTHPTMQIQHCSDMRIERERESVLGGGGQISKNIHIRSRTHIYSR